MGMSRASAWATLSILAVVASLPFVATAADASDVRTVVAAVLDLPAPHPAAATPIEPVQVKTCGCTPQGKQKILTKINGQDVCTATTMPCTAP
jgi:hypothetical protein